MNAREQFLLNIRDVSPMVRAYLNEQSYLAEVETVDVLSDTTIFNLVLNKVNQELITMGIVLECGDDMYTDSNIIKVIYHLRTVFDINHFPELLRGNQELKEILGALLIGDDYDESNLIHEIVSLLNRTFPLSPVYSYLETYMEHFSNNESFHAHIDSMLTGAMIEQHYSNNSVLMSDFTNKVVAYTTVVSNRIGTMSKADNGAVYVTTVDLATAAVAPHILNIIDDSFLPYYLASNDSNPWYCQTVEDGNVVAYRKSCKFFLDHYVGLNAEGYDDTAILGVSSMFYRAEWGLDKNLVELEKECTRLNINQAFKERIVAVLTKLSQPVVGSTVNPNQG